MAPLVDIYAGTHMHAHTHKHKIHTNVRTKVISGNQVHTGLWPARAWFKKL